MIPSVYQAILDALNNDSILVGYLGSNKCFRAMRMQISDLPCITLKTTNEKSSARAGYVSSRHRDESDMIQIDVWISSGDDSFPNTGEDADVIASRVDSILLDAAAPVTNTSQWRKETGSQQHEDDTSVWHNAMRYSFSYNIQD